MKVLLPLVCGTLLATATLGCHDRNDSSAPPPPQQTTTAPAPAPEPNPPGPQPPPPTPGPTQNTQKEKTAAQKSEELARGLNRTFNENVKAPAESAANDSMLRSAGQKVNDAAAATVAAIEGGVGAIVSGVSSGAHHLSDATGAYFKPTEDDLKRREGIEKMGADQRATRATDVAQADQDVLDASPLPVARVQAVLRGDDEVSKNMVALLSEPDGSQIRGRVNAVLDEIFNEPDQARAKVLKVQMALRRLSDANLYSPGAAERVADLQANLDDRVKRDESADTLRDGVLIAASSLALGTAAGLGALDNTREWVRNWSPWNGVKRVGSTIGSGYRATRNGIADVASRSAAAIGRGASKVAAIRLAPAQVAERNLQALDLGGDTIRALNLQRANRSNFPVMAFNDTNLRGFRYAIVTLVKDGGTTESRLVFSVPRWSGMGNKLVASDAMSREEAQALAERLAFKSPAEGGKDFLQMVDQETGETVSTRLTAEDVAEQAPPAAGEEGVAGAEGADQAAVTGAAPQEGVEQPAAAAEGDQPAITADNSGTATTRTAAVRSRRRKSVAEAAADGERTPMSVAEDTAREADAAAAVEAVEAESRPGMISRAASTTVGVAAGAGHAIAQGAVGAGRVVKNGAVGLTVGAGHLAAGAGGVVKTAAVSATRTTARAFRKFDLPWATTVTLGTAVPAYALYFRGYGSGHEYGKDYNSLYLESLIPPEDMQNLNGQIISLRK